MTVHGIRTYRLQPLLGWRYAILKVIRQEFQRVDTTGELQIVLEPIAKLKDEAEPASG